jgi:hypothetical protein
MAVDQLSPRRALSAGVVTLRWRASDHLRLSRRALAESLPGEHGDSQRSHESRFARNWGRAQDERARRARLLLRWLAEEGLAKRLAKRHRGQ